MIKTVTIEGHGDFTIRPLSAFETQDILATCAELCGGMGKFKTAIRLLSQREEGAEGLDVIHDDLDPQALRAISTQENETMVRAIIDPDGYDQRFSTIQQVQKFLKYDNQAFELLKLEVAEVNKAETVEKKQKPLEVARSA